jgi:hypothetical protein
MIATHAGEVARLIDRGGLVSPTVETAADA